jgi:glycosyltransferase involved in cell wall biosynthesis
MPTIALLIPAWNAAAYLPRLLRSAQAQSIPFDQIWVYDDCSTDDTIEVARAFGAQVLRGDVNKGCSAGKNTLAAHVDCDWIHFHDADDELLPNFVALARRWIRSSSPDIILFNYLYRDNDTNELLMQRVFDHEALAADPIRYAIQEQINPFCGLYRREAYLRAGGYDLDPLILYNEDVAFHIKMALHGLSFGAEQEVSLINYRINGSMSGANKLKCYQAHFEVMRRLVHQPQAHAYLIDVADKLWRVCGLLTAAGDWTSARRSARLARSISSPNRSHGFIFRCLVGIHPVLAIYVREWLIRLLRPSLRKP